jgi:ribosomal-protein-alanine N-acetyltransferase
MRAADAARSGNGLGNHGGVARVSVFMAGKEIIIFETSRLILRKLQANDLEDLCRLYEDSDIRRYFPDGVRNRVQTKEELDWYLAGGPSENARLGLWATIHRPTNRFVGRCGLIPWLIDGKSEIEVAYLLDKKFWRQGLGSEVARALVQYAWQELGLTRLIALIHPMNTASIRTATSVGFAFERQVIAKGQNAQLFSVSSRAIL